MVRADESGGVPISSLLGFAVFLGLLFLATQVLVHLYATSTVTAVAFDTARRAAADGGGCPSTAEVRARLGGWGERATVICDRADGEFTTVTISGPSPAAGLRLYAHLSGLGTIERSATVRTEERL